AIAQTARAWHWNDDIISCHYPKADADIDGRRRHSRRSGARPVMACFIWAVCRPRFLSSASLLYTFLIGPWLFRADLADGRNGFAAGRLVFGRHGRICESFDRRYEALADESKRS